MQLKYICVYECVWDYFCVCISIKTLLMYLWHAAYIYPPCKRWGQIDLQHPRFQSIIQEDIKTIQFWNTISTTCNVKNKITNSHWLLVFYIFCFNLCKFISSALAVKFSSPYKIQSVFIQLYTFTDRSSFFSNQSLICGHLLSI